MAIAKNQGKMRAITPCVIPLSEESKSFLPEIVLAQRVSPRIISDSRDTFSLSPSKSREISFSSEAAKK